MAMHIQNPDIRGKIIQLISSIILCVMVIWIPALVLMDPVSGPYNTFPKYRATKKNHKFWLLGQNFSDLFK